MSKRFFVIVLMLLGSLFVLGKPSSNFWVEMVQVQLDGQRLPGFRAPLPESPEEIRAAMDTHFREMGTSLRQSGKEIRVEGYRIKEDTEVDLFFLIESMQGQGAYCSLVAMDASRQVLTSSYRPNLTLLVLQDWSHWVKGMTGTPLIFEHLIYAPRDGLRAYQDTIAILKSGIYAYEELVKEQEFLIDSLLRAVRKNPNRRQAIKAPLNNSTSREIQLSKVLQDSIALVRKRYSRAARLLSESNHRIDSLVNEIRVQKAFLVQFDENQQRLNSTLREIDAQSAKNEALRQENLQLKEQLAEAEGRARIAEEAVTGRRRYIMSKLRLAESQNADLERKLTYAQRAARRDREYILKLTGERQKVKENNDGLIARADSMRKRAERAESLALGLTQRTVTLQQTVDSLRASIHDLAADRRNMLAYQDSLLTEIDLLGPYSREARTRRRVYQEQLAILQDLERRLPAREQALNAREKLLQQREKYLIETDRTGSYTRLRTLLDSLTEANLELNQRLENTRTDQGLSPELNRKEVYMSTLELNEQVYPAFCLDRENSSLAIREQIIDYFRERMRLAPASRTPLTFQSVRLPGLENRRMTLVFSVSDQVSSGFRRISCAVHSERGDYVGPYSDAKVKQAAKALLYELFP